MYGWVPPGGMGYRAPNGANKDLDEDEALGDHDSELLGILTGKPQWI